MTFKMLIVSFTEARNRLKSVLDGVANGADCVVITRRDAKDVVVMSIDYYNSLMETLHLLKSPANAAHLAQSIEQFKHTTKAGTVTVSGEPNVDITPGILSSALRQAGLE